MTDFETESKTAPAIDEASARDESNTRFRRFFDLPLLGVCITSPTKGWLEVNDRLCQILGYSREELQPLTWADLTHPDDLGADVAHFEAVLRGEADVYTIEKRFVRKDGSTVPTDLSVGCVRKADGSVDYFVALLEDVSLRKRAERVREAAYRVSEAAQSVESLPEFFHRAQEILGTLIPADNFYIALLDRETKTLHFPYFVDREDPPPAPRVLGRGLTEYVMRTGESLLAPRSVFDDLVASGDVERHGTPAVDWLGAPLKAHAETIGAVVVQSYTAGVRFGAQDRDFLSFISGQLAMAINRRQSEQRLRESEHRYRTLSEELERRVAERTAALTEANQELEAFSYSVSHELRTPLRAIDGHAAMIGRDHGQELDEGVRSHFQKLRWNAQRMGLLIDDLLVFSRAGRLSLKFSTVDMTSMAREVAALRSPAPASLSRVSISVGDLPMANGDAALLLRVWENLLSNAVKFSAGRERPEISAEGAIEHGEAIYRVRDNGVGFDMKYVDKLFGVFHRLHGQREFEGTGVGLALVRRIVLRHGGRVWAEGELDRGATFSFALPLKPPSGSGTSCRKLVP